VKLKPGQHIHLVGIGGSGLSAIARILLGQGYKVSGSDRSTNELMDVLAHDGTIIYHGHDARYVDGADVLIITSAVKDDHVEVGAAHARGIPVYKRQDIIADLMIGKTVIAVAGTKGKTTTTSMIVHILRECGLDPGYIVGGVMGNTQTNAGVGQGEVFVIEADEYDDMFLGLQPNIIVLTNVEYDHPDFFKTPEAMVGSFRHFIGQMADGLLVACADDPIARQIAHEYQSKHQVVMYGVENAAATIRATAITCGEYTDFEIASPEGRLEARVELPGRHNVLNALAAYCATKPIASDRVTNEMKIAKLATFKPTARRFDLRADIHGIAVLDDYAHNPTSIRVTLDAARQRYPDRALWAIWQPHTYSRTQALFDQFVKSFEVADHVLITDIYAAREAPVPGVSSAAVVAAMVHTDVRHMPTFEDAVAILSAEVRPPAVVLIMSAGDAPQIGIEYVKLLQARANAEVAKPVE
jgi:UDP-N-acetylmuramate--alanine ligase